MIYCRTKRKHVLNLQLCLLPAIVRINNSYLTNGREIFQISFSCNDIKLITNVLFLPHISLSRKKLQKKKKPKYMKVYNK